MKSTCLTSVACAALLIGSAIAAAQTSPNTSSNQSGTVQGNDLDTTSKSPSVNPTSSPPSAGQNRDNGNDMVSPNGTQSTMKQANATRPDFNTLDKKGKGSLSAADVKGNQWLRKNFSRCDTDHDGTLSREEYNNCR